MVNRLIVGDGESQTYVFTVQDTGRTAGKLDHRDKLELKVFEGANSFDEDDQIGTEVTQRGFHSGGGQHYVDTGVNQAGEALNDESTTVRDVIGGFLNANDTDDLFNAIVNGELTGVENVRIDTTPIIEMIDGEEVEIPNVVLTFDLLTNLARNGNNLETAVVDTIQINFNGVTAGLDMEAIPSIGGALTDTINNTNVEGADFAVLADENGDLHVSVDTGLVEVTEKVGDRFLFGNSNTVGDDIVSDLRGGIGPKGPQNGEGASGLEVLEGFGFGGFITAEEIDELTGERFDTITFEGIVDGDTGGVAVEDLSLTFGSKESSTVQSAEGALTGLIDGLNSGVVDDNAANNPTVNISTDGDDVIVTVTDEDVTKSFNAENSFLFGNTQINGALDPEVAAISNGDPVTATADGKPLDIDVGGSLSAAEVDVLADAGVAIIEGVETDPNAEFAFNLTFGDSVVEETTPSSDDSMLPLG